MPAGRPSKYTQSLADKIISRLACGESMRSVSRDPAMPCMETMWRWLREKPEFSQRYDKAKTESAEALVDDMLDIADNQVQTPLIVDGNPIYDKEGNPVMTVTNTSVNHARLRVDTRKFVAAKLQPYKYGEHRVVETPDLSDVLQNLIDKLPN